MSVPKLKEIVLDRIPVEIMLAHEALGMYSAIAEAADFLRSSSHCQLFGIIQHQAMGAFVLSLCKLFEKQSSKFPNYSIPTALEYLRANLAGVTVPKQRASRFDDFIRAEIDPTFDVFNLNKATTVPDLVYCHFADVCPQTPPRDGKRLDMILEALKVLRDKRVAHYEDFDLKGLAQTDLDGAVELLCFAQTFVNIVGYGFFGFSRRSIAQPAEFAPAKSESSIQMRTMIQELEQVRVRERGTADVASR